VHRRLERARCVVGGTAVTGAEPGGVGEVAERVGAALQRRGQRAAARTGEATQRPVEQLEVDTASYFLSKIELRAGDARTLPRWRKRLVLATSRITSDAADYFDLPRDQTVIMGSHIEV
jgi:KUP system potassium uptake protein